VAGFAAAVAVRRHGHELAGVAITGLLAALLSPVAWIHHLCWVIIAIGVLTGDGRNWRRLGAAAAASALFATNTPIWGKNLFEHNAAPIPLTRFLEATFGLAAIVLIVAIYAFRPTAADTLPAAAAAPGGSAGADDALLAGSGNR